MAKTSETPSVREPSSHIHRDMGKARPGCAVEGCTRYRARGCALCDEHTGEASKAALFVRSQRERAVQESPALSALLAARRSKLFDWSTDCA